MLLADDVSSVSYVMADAENLAEWSPSRAVTAVADVRRESNFSPRAAADAPTHPDAASPSCSWPDSNTRLVSSCQPLS